MHIKHLTAKPFVIAFMKRQILICFKISAVTSTTTDYFLWAGQGSHVWKKKKNESLELCLKGSTVKGMSERRKRSISTTIQVSRRPTPLKNKCGYLNSECSLRKKIFEANALSSRLVWSFTRYSDHQKPENNTYLEVWGEAEEAKYEQQNRPQRNKAEANSGWRWGKGNWKGSPAPPTDWARQCFSRKAGSLQPHKERQAAVSTENSI